ncbi:uncharacterized protein LOC116200094 isoform X3 [Punica granatum]|uniref:non-specific serine/threonine protein kinase n=1 Tax=Punica granatum TaxID=22663 RepID=A0A6P8CQB6_PUNGR|nr:uncharacterized protein LOC116200094 isoform X3 [Punica granatum]
MNRRTAIYFFFCFVIIAFTGCLAEEQRPWIKAGYWYAGSESPIPDINSALFTHLICAFAAVNTSTFELSIPPSALQYFSTFTNITKLKNPSLVTLLSIWNGLSATNRSMLGLELSSSPLSSMVSDPSRRKSFIESSIRTARLYGFKGLDLFWVWPQTASDMIHMASLFDEWRAAVESEPRDPNEPKLILTMGVHYSPTCNSVNYPVEKLRKNFDWVHLVTYDYHLPMKEGVAGAPAALYDPRSDLNTDFGIKEWIRREFPVNKLVLGLPFHGYAWTLVGPGNDRIGAPASGLAVTRDGSMSYKYIKWYVRSYKASVVYDANYVTNYCSIGLIWIGFDDVEAIKAKVAYAREKGLTGFNVFQVINDDNWVLSHAAQEDACHHRKTQRLCLIVLLPIVLIAILLALVVCYFRSRGLRPQGVFLLRRMSQSSSEVNASTAQNFEEDTPNLLRFSFGIIRAATDNFSDANKLGEGGYGPVFKGELPNGQVMAVKRLSESSIQGVEEFKNEVTLTARLQHVNLVRLLGFCTDRQEKMLIYEYLPNKNLDYYLFDPIRRRVFDWGKRVKIIEGVCQGLLYLQEYSNFTVIHRDLKGGNILLDAEMNPKISDFGMAKLFRKGKVEANTGRIVGTYGFVPPEYVQHGLYSMKYDVYSFGVVLLQIISSKRISNDNGPNEDWNLSEYAYELWKEGKEFEFIDPILDDSDSLFKTTRCLQVGLLCVQTNPVDRPSMVEVCSMLKSEASSTIPLPRRPAFSAKKDEFSESITPSNRDEVADPFVRQSAAARTNAAPVAVKGAYWPSWFADTLPPSAIETSLFTHIYFAFLSPSNETYKFEVSGSTAALLSNFTMSLSLKRPRVKTLISIGGGGDGPDLYSRMASSSSTRKAFIDSSIALARKFGFDGLDLDWEFPQNPGQMEDFGLLLKEWRAAVNHEARAARRPPLLLTAAVYFAADFFLDEVHRAYPARQISENLDWINAMCYDYHGSWDTSATGAQAAFFDPNSNISSSYGLGSWIRAGVPRKKIIMGLPLYGRTWELKDPNINGIGAAAVGLGPGDEGVLLYHQVVAFNKQNGAEVVYDKTTVSTYSYLGKSWIGYDDVTSTTAKIKLAQSLRLGGYFFWALSYDNNWTISTQASKAWPYGR